MARIFQIAQLGHPVLRRVFILSIRPMPRYPNGFAARVFLHENDHLEGMTWLDHVEDNRDIVTEKEYLRQITG